MSTFPEYTFVYIPCKGQVYFKPGFSNMMNFIFGTTGIEITL